MKIIMLIPAILLIACAPANIQEQRAERNAMSWERETAFAAATERCDAMGGYMRIDRGAKWSQRDVVRRVPSEGDRYGCVIRNTTTYNF